MQLPLEITFRDVPRSEVLEDYIREKAEKLDRFYDRIMACRVVVERPHSHHHKGQIYHVRIDLTVPGGELVVKRHPHDNHAHEDPYVAARDAFKAIQRQLQDYARKQRGDTKTHVPPPHGIVSVIMPGQDYGRILSSEGGDIYFHRNSVVEGGFDLLEEGDEVWFVEEAGDEGPQASTVHIVGKHHPLD